MIKPDVNSKGFYQNQQLIDKSKVKGKADETSVTIHEETSLIDRERKLSDSLYFYIGKLGSSVLYSLNAAKSFLASTVCRRSDRGGVDLFVISSNNIESRTTTISVDSPSVF